MFRCYVPFSGNNPLVVNINGHDLLFVGADPECFEESSILEEFSDAMRSFEKEAFQKEAVQKEAVQKEAVQKEAGQKEDSQRKSESDTPEGYSALEKVESTSGVPLSQELLRGDSEGMTAAEYSRVLRSFENCYPLGSELELREYNLDTIELPEGWVSPSVLGGAPVLGGDEGVPESNPPFVQQEVSPLTPAINGEVPALLQRFQNFAHVMASQESSGVVFVPQAASFDALVATLEDQLPWCH